MNLITRILDWRLSHFRTQLGLPDLPEIRRLMRLSWWNGFTFGMLERKVAVAYLDAFMAIGRAALTDSLSPADRACYQEILAAMTEADLD